LLKELRVTEVNQVAVRLLNVSSCEQAWERLIDDCPRNATAIGYQVLEAVLTQQNQLELEIQLNDVLGNNQYLWLVMRLPEQRDDFKAVILSISDITSRKLIELSLVERESFWSDVVRTVPDHLYVQDVISQRMIFSNHHLGHTLGYNKAELQQMGEYFWEILLHPEDAEHYHDLRQQQRQAGYSSQLQCQLRFRHRNNQWRRFDIREQALAGDKTAQVTRIIGVAKDITDQIEASESLRDSEQRYRMLAESISDVICSTDSRLALNYISPSVNAVLGYDVDWVFKNGWQSIIANPQQLAGIYSLVEQVSRALGDAEALAKLRDDIHTQLYLFDCLRADGRKVPIELRLVLVWDEHGAFEGILGVGRDISQQRRAEKDLRMAATVFEHSTSAILITDRPAISCRPTRRSAASVATPWRTCSTSCRTCSPSTSSRKPTCAMCSSSCTSTAPGKAKCGSSAATASITRPGSALPLCSTMKATWPATSASSAISASARPANSASTAWPITTP